MKRTRMSPLLCGALSLCLPLGCGPAPSSSAPKSHPTSLASSEGIVALAKAESSASLLLAPPTPAPLSSAPLSVTSAVPVQPPTLAPLPPMAVDADGEALGGALLRRFGGLRFRASRNASLHFANTGELAIATTERAGASPTQTTVLVMRSAATAKVLFSRPMQSSWSSRYAISADLRTVVHGKKDALVQDAATGKQYGQRRGLVGDYALTGAWVVGRRNKQLVAWNHKTGTTRTLATLRGDLSEVRAAVAAPVVVAVESRTRKVKKRRQTEMFLWMFDLRNGRRFVTALGPRNNWQAVALEAAGRYALIVRNRDVERIDLGKTKTRKLLRLPKHMQRWGVGPLRIVINDPMAVATRGENLSLFDTDTGDVQQEQDLGSEITSLALSPDGATVATLTELGEIRRIDVGSEKQVARPPGNSWIGAADIDEQTNLALTAGSRLDIWDVASGKQRIGAELPQRLVAGQLLSAKKAVTVDVSGQVSLWDLDTLTSTSLQDGRKRRAREADPPLAVDRRRQRVAYVAVAESKYGDGPSNTVVADRNGKELYTLPHAAEVLAFDGMGRLATSVDGAVTVYDTKGAPVSRWRSTLDRRKRNVRALSFSPSNKLLAIAAASGTIIWDIAHDKIVRGTHHRATTVAFLNDGHVILGTSAGELVTLTLAGPAERSSKLFKHPVRSIQANRRGILVASEFGGALLVSRDSLRPKTGVPQETTIDVELKMVGSVPGAESIRLYGGYRTLGGCVDAQGALTCWGKNERGVMGFGDSKPRVAPTAMPLSSVKAFDLNGDRGCAIVDASSSGSSPASQVYCWGATDDQAGRKWKTVTTKPRLVSAFGSSQRKLSLNRDGWCAVDAGGAVRCLRQNTQSRGGRNDRDVPRAVVGLRHAQQVVMGGRHACAIDKGGQVWCWGNNDVGQLGYGRASSQASAHAVAVVGVTDATALALGTQHSCALRASGTVTCWGAGTSGQLGDGLSAPRPLATDVPGITGASAITAGPSNNCAVVVGGTVRCWGELYNKKASLLHSTPVTIAGLHDVRALASAASRTCVVVADGGVHCWGRLD